MMKRILVVSSSGDGYAWQDTLCAGRNLSVEQARWDELLRGSTPSPELCLLVAVLDQPRSTSIDSLRRLTCSLPQCPCLAVLPEDSAPELIRGAATVAGDFVILPMRPEELACRVDRFLAYADDDVARSQQSLAEEACLRDFVTQDPSFLGVLTQIRKLARANAPVLIVGETGTGKELCARALHHLGPRRHGPFIPVDCAALPENLFENELFGHVRGSFTDAHSDQKGLVALAQGGTLFLDEVDSLTALTQAKLLRFLQDRAYRPLGSDRFLTSDVTVLAATNRDLRELVEKREFRVDLYFRLNVLSVALSPLRDRPSDITLLAEHYVRRFARPGEPVPIIDAQAADALRQYHWPGNVRELVNIIQRAVALTEERFIRVSHLEFCDRTPALPERLQPSTFREARAQAVEEFERNYISNLLHEHHGNVTHAARAANRERRAFGRMIKKYGIDKAS
jgi:DNA-binding NtrC family response regulator